MTEEEMKDLEKNRQAINREQQASEEHIMHKVWSLSVQEAVDLISILPTVDGDDGDLPQHTKGPLG